MLAEDFFVYITLGIANKTIIQITFYCSACVISFILLEYFFIANYPLVFLARDRRRRRKRILL
jgi:hypothetical protein